MSRLTRGGLLGLILGVAIAGPCGPSAHAQEFYRGKTLTLVIGNTAGSGYDIYGRMISRYLMRHLPGKPTIVPQNMPGAGSVKAAEYIYAVAPKDGTLIGTIMPGALMDPLVNGLSKYRYVPSKFEFLGTADSGTKLCFSSDKSRIKSFQDAQRNKAVVASTARADYSLMVRSLAKAQFQIVTGYPGPAEMIMALERGEGDVVCGLDLSALNTLRPGILTSGKINLLLQFGLEARPSLSALGVPELWSFIAPEDRPVVELVFAEQVFQRTFLAPPGTPRDLLAILRAAFDMAMKDPDLLDEARRSNLEINPKSGSDVAAVLDKVYATPREVVERMGKVAR